MSSRSAPTGALVLTAGLGMRLRPLTRDRAKPALPVAGPTLVERILTSLARAGIRDALLNLHYQPASITAIVGDGSALGLSARYSWEMPLLGSGGGPRRAFSLVPSDRLWLINGDTLTDVDLTAMAEAHAGSSALVTMALIPNASPERYGGVVVSDEGEVRAFVPRGTPGQSWHFVGVQIAERAAFQTLTDGVAADSVGPLYRALIAERPGAVRGFCTNAQFLDIGTPRDYLAACLALSGGRTTVGRDTVIDPTARVDASVVWDRARIGRGARLSRVVVGDDVTVPDEFEAADVVLMTGGREGTIPGAWPLQSFPIA